GNFFIEVFRLFLVLLKQKRTREARHAAGYFSEFGNFLFGLQQGEVRCRHDSGSDIIQVESLVCCSSGPHRALCQTNELRNKPDQEQYIQRIEYRMENGQTGVGVLFRIVKRTSESEVLHSPLNATQYEREEQYGPGYTDDV